MYWRWSRIPELADLPPQERKRLWYKARRDAFHLTDFLWLALILGVMIVAGIALTWLPKNLSIWLGLPITLFVVIGVGALMDAILIHRYRPIVRRLRTGG